MDFPCRYRPHIPPPQPYQHLIKGTWNHNIYNWFGLSAAGIFILSHIYAFTADHTGTAIFNPYFYYDRIDVNTKILLAVLWIIQR
jgi:hypothetical protein